MGGKHGARSAKTSHDLIKNERDTCLPSQSTHSLQPAFGLHHHTCHSLNHGFYHPTCVCLPFALSLFQGSLNRLYALPLTAPVQTGIPSLSFGPIEWASIAIRRHHLVGAKEESIVCAVKERHLPQTHGPHRISMVSLIQRKKSRMLGNPTTHRVFIGHLEGRLQGGRAIIRKEHLSKFRIC